ncbi:DsbE family thiol:disulfide interchange protein [Parvularcula sp. ZS-1/3]|uniref:DsbE family thiol:disulfide interchange protein n=1 Tax=Parvularcula mediterranea TaxID=2732508 RepID=A0A7Y3W3X2_9PROT|nr:DsbE family thiol:disulfide interchange protein [Parvularcula mediterranea]NNU14888.1 DsbE family thiol:disulfide interchange protein [Parvularcula mediterranea]
MKKQILILPAIMFAVVAVFAFRALDKSGQPAPSALMNLPAPSIELEPIPRFAGPFDTGVPMGEVTLVNVFGSWCVFCLYEHPLLLQKKEQGLTILGIAWNEPPEASAQWLERHGNPYTMVGADQRGFAIAEFGVTGAPETFVLDKNGVIRFRYQGPITEKDWRRDFAPLIARLEKEEAAPAAAR